ncbi:hypothetical protein [Synechococcus elongatus]|nr:hypothetical protein [Synechococcus elongatus]MBD2587813.1 hypothetical protein [Synechococcus elongatus FACHB-242]MBD2707479.1 hypothetical protein [Synechococcus elongatus PCC 7942 = FACHB-805]
MMRKSAVAIAGVLAALSASTAWAQSSIPLPTVPAGGGSSLSTTPLKPLSDRFVVRLRYTGPGLSLQSALPIQEVMTVDQNVTDSRGQVILPIGTPVLGRFETNQQGSRFVAQALVLNGVSVPIYAISEVITGPPTADGGRVANNAGVGAAAGLVVGGPVGLVGGAAVGAASAFGSGLPATSLQPNQVLEVLLTSAW